MNQVFLVAIPATAHYGNYSHFAPGSGAVTWLLAGPIIPNSVAASPAQR